MRQILSLALVSLFVIGCTTTSFVKQEVKPPPKKFTAVVVGEIGAADPKVKSFLPFFRDALVKRLREEKGIETVIDDAKASPGVDAFVVSGKLTEMDLGSAAARFLIGFGAGRQELKGKFEIRAADGTELASFASSENYAGGAGIGGFSAITLEELAQKFGGSTAAAVARWARGERLDRTSEGE